MHDQLPGTADANNFRFALPQRHGAGVHGVAAQDEFVRILAAEPSMNPVLPCATKSSGSSDGSKTASSPAGIDDGEVRSTPSWTATHPDGVTFRPRPS